MILAVTNWVEKIPDDSQPENFPIFRILGYGVDILAVSKDRRNLLHHIFDNPNIDLEIILMLLQQGRDICKLLMKQNITRDS